jgi:hypothetical protein
MFFRTATSASPIHFRTPSIWAAFVLASLLAASLASAQAPTDDEVSPPSRVGRIGLIEGDVSFYADREEGWRKARLNFPVTSKNSVWTNGQGRAEVRFGASVVRIDGDTMLDFVKVDDQRTSLFLQRGTANIRIRSYTQSGSRGDDYRDQFRIETDSGTWTLDQSGRYRIESSPDRNETRLAVFVGTARFENSAANLKVEPGKMLVVRGSAAASSFNFERANEANFDRWAEARDVRWDETHQRVASSEVISPYMTGYEDLDANGDWIDDAEYGRLWTPRTVVAGWVPYRYGSWSYVRPWGWTWIDDAPWGFAPFHYGRWVQIRARWYWAPGRYHHRPIYAPALVTWFGDGNTSISISVGPSVGWCPLAPREHYIPAYTNNVTYIRNINYVTNNVTVINRPTRYVNQQNGGTIVGHNVVVGGEPVWRQPNLQIGSRIQKPLRDPSSGADPNAPPRWVPTNPPPGPAAPTPVVYPGAPRPTAITGEAPNSRRPTWVVGEPVRPQNNAAVPPSIEQPQPIATPSSPRVIGAPPSSSAPEPVAPIARPKPTPRIITNSELPPNTGNLPSAPSPARESLPPRSEPIIASEPVRRERLERVERMERSERAERGERMERGERGNAGSNEVRQAVPRNDVRVVRPESAPNAQRPEQRPEGGRQGSGATPGAIVVKPKEGREEKPNERGERNERTPKTANQ